MWSNTLDRTKQISMANFPIGVMDFHQINFILKLRMYSTHILKKNVPVLSYLECYKNSLPKVLSFYWDSLYTRSLYVSVSKSIGHALGTVFKASHLT